MSELRALIDQFEADDSLVDFSLQESKALFDLLLLTVMIDGEITTEELEKVSAEAERFPFGGAEYFAETIKAHAAATKAELDEIVGDEEAVQRFVAARTEQIVEVEKRREALTMIAVVAYADGVDPREEDLVHRIGEHFGFSRDEIEGKLIVGSVKNMG